jgi:hypothetical protein
MPDGDPARYSMHHLRLEELAGFGYVSWWVVQMDSGNARIVRRQGGHFRIENCGLSSREQRTFPQGLVNIDNAGMNKARISESSLGAEPRSELGQAPNLIQQTSPSICLVPRYCR